MNIATYKVHFTGFAYVEADSEDDAREKFYEDKQWYEESDISDVQEDGKEE